MTEENEIKIEQQIFQEIKDQKNTIVELFNTFEAKFGKSNLEDRIGQLNSIENLINCLETQFNSNTYQLPKQDIFSNQKSINDLRKEYLNIKQKFTPKKKFMFKNRELLLKKPKLETIENVTSTKIDPSVFKYSIKIINNFAVFDGKDNMLKQSDNNYQFTLNEGTVQIQDLSGYNIQIKGNISQVFLKNINDCKIYLGCISSSVLVYTMNNSTLSVYCHQVRCHDSDNLQLSMYVTSQPIIEFCTNIVATGPNFKFNDMDAIMKESGLVRDNLWNIVNDFNWIKNDEKSPNFELKTEIQMEHIDI